MMIKDKAIVYHRGRRNKEIHPEEYKITLDLNHERIGIGMSGGMDSAMLLWLLAYHIDKNNLDVTIYIWSCILDERPFQLHHAKKVVKFIKEYFPNVKFGEHVHKPTIAQDYIENGTKLSWEMCKEYKVTALYNGVTVNPPKEYGETVWGKAWNKRAESRDWEVKHNWDSLAGEWVNDHMEYLPFIHYDKRIVLAFYKKYGLLLEMGPLTRSCEGWAEESNYFQEECKRCWWCIEKRWATAMIWNHDPIKALESYPGVIEV
tara:strand:+ start:2101 stop:2883 length:783 start_codon:yes stop_codon:yes gene_type:complete